MKTLVDLIEELCVAYSIPRERIGAINMACGAALDENDAKGLKITAESSLRCYTAGCETKEEVAVMAFVGGYAVATAMFAPENLIIRHDEKE